jgi:hypothetical protein
VGRYSIVHLVINRESIFEIFLSCILGSSFDDTFNKVRISFFWGFVVIFILGGFGVLFI